MSTFQKGFIKHFYRERKYKFKKKKLSNFNPTFLGDKFTPDYNTRQNGLNYTQIFKYYRLKLELKSISTIKQKPCVLLLKLLKIVSNFSILPDFFAK